jgi:ABC-type Na+ efflux pump permease subunit
MRALLTVFRKEFLENLRDRRTLFSALLFGPLFGPILFGAMVSRMLNQSVLESDEPLRVDRLGRRARAQSRALPDIARREARVHLLVGSPMRARR